MMGFFEDVGSAFGGAVGWAQDRAGEAASALGDIATGVSSAVLGKEIKKYDEKKRKMITVRQGGLFGAAGGFVEEVGSGIETARKHTVKQMGRYGHIDTKPKVGDIKNGQRLVERSTVPGTKRVVERWLPEAEYQRRLKRYKESLPSATSIGQQYKQSHPRDPTLPLKSAAGTVLEMDFRNMFSMDPNPLQRGLAHWTAYEKDPKRVAYSPFAIDVYTTVATWGVGKFVARPALSFVGAKTAGAKGAFWGRQVIKPAGAKVAAKASTKAYSPFIAPVVKKATPIVRKVAPGGANIAQLTVGGAIVPVVGYGVYQSGKSVAKAGTKRTEIKTLPSGKKYTIERGGWPDFGGEIARQSAYWYFGIRGVMGKPYLPRSAHGPLSTRVMKAAGLRELPQTAKAIKAARAGRVVEVTARKGETLAQAKQRLFSKAGLKNPEGIKLVSKDGRYVTSVGGRLKSGHLSKGMWVAPAETSQLYFLKSSGYRNISLVPVKTIYRPRVNMLIAQSPKVYNPFTQSVGKPKWAKSPRGFKFPYPKRAAGTKQLFHSAQTIAGSKAELEATIAPGMMLKRTALRKVPGYQRVLQRTLFGGSQYYVKDPVMGRNILVDFYKPTGPAKVFVPKGSSIAHMKPPTMGTTPGYSPLPPSSLATSYYTPFYNPASYVSGAEQLYLPGGVSYGRGGGGQPSYVSKIAYGAGSKVAAESVPPGMPPWKIKQQKRIYRYKIPEQKDYYDELKQAYGDLFGGEI